MGKYLSVDGLKANLEVCYCPPFYIAHGRESCTNMEKCSRCIGKKKLGLFVGRGEIRM